MALSKTVLKGDLIPRGYGCAYYVSHTHAAVFYPIPLNWFIGWLREVWWFLMIGPRDRAYETDTAAESLGFARGYKCGRVAVGDAEYRRGYAAGASWSLSMAKAAINGDKLELPEFDLDGRSINV